ncbi:TPA: hypothetical protein DCY65_02300 [Candidatus Acetothermia bacterium]|nr:hypothetical protein [Candidatus Acetothermia bacterium]
MTLDELARRGLIRPYRPERSEIRSLVLAAIRRCEDAENRSIHGETRLEQAYHAILSCALIGLRANGYRPARGAGSHELTLQTLAETLRLDPGRLDYYQALRHQRHQGLYEGFAEVQSADADAAVQDARFLLREMLDCLREHHPSLVPSDLSDVSP